MKKYIKILCLSLVIVLSLSIIIGCGNDKVPPPIQKGPDENISSVLPDYWVESSYVNVFKDAKKIKDSAEEIEISTALNERESSQIVLRSLSNFDINGVEFNDLINESDETKKISKDNLKYNYVEYYYFDSNSQGSVDSDIVRKGADFYPDALSNEKKIKVSKQTSQPIWLTLYTPTQTEAGKYRGIIKVKTSLGDVDVNINVEVFDIIVPDSSDGEYTIAFWNQILGTGFGVAYDDYHGTETIAMKYGYERYSDAWWKLINDIAVEMQENRLNAMQIHTIQLLADGGSTVTPLGNNKFNYEFNWSKFDEYVEFFLNKGFIKMLNGYVMMAGANVNYLTYNSQNAKTVVGQIAYNDVNGVASDWLDEYISALYAHLEEKGWLDMWFQNLKDEAKVADKPIYTFIFDKARKHAPKMKVGDALDDSGMIDFIMEKDVDVHIPLSSMHSSNLAKYQAKQAQRDNVIVLSYTCVLPQGIQLNRFIDKPVWQGRSLAWYNYNTNTNGFLHWGLMAWYREIYEFANGDTATIYPDIKNNSIKSSIRMAAVRDGAEDFELLKLLEKQELEIYKSQNEEDISISDFNPISKKLANLIAKTSSNYLRDINMMIQIRIALLKALTGDFSLAEAIIANA